MSLENFPIHPEVKKQILKDNLIGLHDYVLFREIVKRILDDLDDYGVLLGSLLKAAIEFVKMGHVEEFSYLRTMLMVQMLTIKYYKDELSLGGIG